MGDQAIDFPTVLLRLIEVAENVILRPSHAPRLDQVTSIAATVEAARQIMVEGGNPLRMECSMLVDALAQIEMFRGAGEDPTQWQMVASGLLPMVKNNMPRALDQRRKATRISTTEQDYHRRGTR